jgi:hypothetical protein
MTLQNFPIIFVSLILFSSHLDVSKHPCLFNLLKVHEIQTLLNDGNDFTFLAGFLLQFVIDLPLQICVIEDWVSLEISEDVGFQIVQGVVL